MIDSLRLSRSEVQDALAQAERELGIREERFRAERPMQSIAGRSVVLVDDGWATGATAAAAAQGLLGSGVSNVIVTTPVAAPEAVARLEATGAETIVLETPAKMRAVGAFYLLIFPVTTDQCISLLIADRQPYTAI